MESVVNKQITAFGVLTYKDFKQHIFYQIKKNIFIIFIVTLGISTLYFRFTTYGDLMTVWMKSITRSLSFSVVLLLIVWIIIWLSIRRIFRKYQSTQQEKKYIINNEGIHQTSTHADLYIEWIDIFKIKNYQNFFHIYLSRKKVVIIPKRFFQNREDLLQFEKLIKSMDR